MNLDFNHKEDYALNYYSEFLKQEYMLPDESIEAVIEQNPDFTSELITELTKPLIQAENCFRNYGSLTNFQKEMNSTLFQYYMDIESVVSKHKALDFGDLERE